ncbi:BEN domain-containing protein 5 [Frankliniella fusca]|uniref:BEN domain-containing protein 5 n=1 Tax=Frankliniella fusca TaxID=407009 RepID=A0AAE1LEJ8_9NEOP|nr:BEN domain-containing protein 5 [Frankliniella fusca]
MKYALVQFRENGRNVKAQTLCSNIKDFNPANADDFEKDKQYQIKWQKSVVDDDFTHDGYFPGKILLLAATPEEIKVKAKDAGIKLPSHLLIVKAISSPSPMKRPLRKSRVKKGEESDESTNRKKRMMDTLQMLNDSGSSQLSEDLAKPEMFSNITSSSKIMMKSNSCSSVLHKKEKVETPALSFSAKSSCKNVKKSDSGSTLASKTTVKTEPASSFSPPKCSSKNMRKSDSGLTSPSQIESKTLSPTSPSDNSINRVSLKSRLDSALQEERSVRRNLNKDLKHEKKNKQFGGEQSDSSSGDFGDTDEDEDDVAVKLDNLEKEHSLCEVKFSELKLEISKLKSAQKEFEKVINKNLKISKLMDKVTNLSNMNMSLQHHLFGGSTGKKTDISKCAGDSDTPNCLDDALMFQSPAKNLSAEFSPVNDSPQLTPRKKSSSVEDCSLQVVRDAKSTTPKRSSSPKTARTKNAATDESDEESIAQRIEDDLREKRLLAFPNDDPNKVYVGSGISINKQFWEEKVRKQRDDSKFTKDATQGIWGVENLKQRVTSKATGSKKAATPSKLRLVTGMLRGKLRARNLSKGEIDTMVQSKALGWIGAKMYDVTRTYKPKKSKTPPSD